MFPFLLVAEWKITPFYLTPFWSGTADDSSCKHRLSMRQQGVYSLSRSWTYLSGMFRVTSVIVVIVLIVVWTEITTSVPVIVSTSGPRTTVTTTVESAAWLTTVTVPPMIAETGTCFLNHHHTHISNQCLHYSPPCSPNCCQCLC